MKFRIILLTVCLAGIPLIALDNAIQGTNEKTVNNVQNNMQEHDSNKALWLIQTHLDRARDYTKNMHFYDAARYLHEAQNTLKRVNSIRNDDNRRNLNQQINAMHAACNKMKHRIIQAANTIDVDTYAHNHSIPPDEFIKKLYTGTWSDEDVITYTKYRIISRMKQRISHSEIQLDSNDPQIQDIQCDDCIHPHVMQLGEDVDSVINCLLQEGIEVDNLLDTPGTCIGKLKIKIDRNHLKQFSPFKTLHNIEHEISHLEEFNDLYINATPFGQSHLEEQSRREYSADYEATRFTPLAYACHMEFASGSKPYHLPRKPQQGQGPPFYPPIMWIDNMLSHRARNLSDNDKTYQHNLYATYGFSIEKSMLTGTSVISALVPHILNYMKITGPTSTGVQNISFAIMWSHLLLSCNSLIYGSYPQHIGWKIAQCTKPLHIATAYFHNWLPVRAYNKLQHYISDILYIQEKRIKNIMRSQNKRT